MLANLQLMGKCTNAHIFKDIAMCLTAFTIATIQAGQATIKFDHGLCIALAA